MTSSLYPKEPWEAEYLAPFEQGLGPRPPTPLEEAERAAAMHMGRYPHTRNGLLIWRAYLEFRSRGLSPPDWILTKFDQWAKDLEQSEGASDVAAAIEMYSSKGGPGAAARLRQSEDGWRIANQVHRLTRRGGGNMTDMDAFRTIGSIEGMKAGTVKQTYLRWFPKKQNKREPDALHAFFFAPAPVSRDEEIE